MGKDKQIEDTFDVEVDNAFSEEEIAVAESAGTEVVETEATKEKKETKPVEMLTIEEMKEVEGATKEKLFEKYQDTIKLLYGKWADMNETHRRALNKSFRKAGVFGAGKDVVPKNKAQQKALDLQKLLREAAYDHVNENYGEQINELLNLNKDVKVSIEIYFKGWKKFYTGLEALD